MIQPRPRNATAGAAVALMLLPALAARAEERLAPIDPSGPPVRIVLVVPTDSGRLARQVKRLEAELRSTRGRIVRARSLDEADAIVEFVEYRRTRHWNGKSADWWHGQFKLLSPAAREAQLARGIPERFGIVLFGREAWEMEPVLDLLGRTLAKPLGREARPVKSDSI